MREGAPIVELTHDDTFELRDNKPLSVVKGKVTRYIKFLERRIAAVSADLTRAARGARGWAESVAIHESRLHESVVPRETLGRLRSARTLQEYHELDVHSAGQELSDLQSNLARLRRQRRELDVQSRAAHHTLVPKVALVP